MTGLFPLLSDALVFELLVSLLLGAFASFFAIVSWTRNPALEWIFVIAGILASYAGTLYRALRSFGLFAGSDFPVFGLPLGILVSENIPILLFALAGIFYIRSHK